MLTNKVWVAVVLAALGTSHVIAASRADKKLWAAARSGKADKVARYLQKGAPPDSRLVALAVSVASDKHKAFRVLWNHDNSDIAQDAIDYALCYAYRNPVPNASIRDVLDERDLTIDACCEGNREQAYCARRPVKLTAQSFPATECRTVFTDEKQLPAGATKVAVLWDERVSVFDPVSSARYGPQKLSKAGATDWAMEFAPVLGALGADAILIMSAETDARTATQLTRYPALGSFPSTVSGFTVGTVTDRIEILALRTRSSE